MKRLGGDRHINESEVWWRALHSEDSWRQDHLLQSEVEVRARGWLLLFSDLQL